MPTPVSARFGGHGILIHRRVDARTRRTLRTGTCCIVSEVLAAVCLVAQGLIHEYREAGPHPMPGHPIC